MKQVFFSTLASSFKQVYTYFYVKLKLDKKHKNQIKCNQI